MPGIDFTLNFFFVIEFYLYRSEICPIFEKFNCLSITVMVARHGLK